MNIKKVLIVDDEPLVRKTTAMLLRFMHVDTVMAESGQEGLALAEKERPDIILLDIVMPGMDGWSVLERLKADERLSKIPVVVFSADTLATSIAEATKKGASAVCKKPFHPDELLAIIKKL
jgi:CheY-like chemotaxis protein